MQVYPRDFRDALAAIPLAGEVMELRAVVMRALGLIGITRAYFLAPLTSDPRVGRILTNAGFAGSWARRYAPWMHRIDPLPGVAVETAGAFVWPDALDPAQLTQPQRRYLEMVARFGMGRGIGAACYGPHGRSGFLGAGWDQPGAPSADELHWVHHVGQLSFQRYCLLHRQVQAYPALSARELEVLGWMSEGKSNPVIAEIIGVSRATVDIYVRRIFGKLDVTDRTAACLRGYALGYTVSGDYKLLVRNLSGGTLGPEPEVISSPPVSPRPVNT